MSIITPTTSTGTSTLTSGATSTAAQGQASLNADYTDFLKLLTTQLQNQDPTAPMDSTQFTQQLVSLAGVEQSVNTNANLEKIVSLNQSNQVSQTASYIGKTVQADGSAAQLSNGRASFTYTLPSNAANTTVTISDSTGKVVFSGPGQTVAGQYSYNWNGLDANSNEVAPGIYNIAVSGVDTDGKTITATTTTAGVVQAVTIDNNVPTLHLDNGTTATLDKVQGIAQGAVSDTSQLNVAAAYIGKAVQAGVTAIPLANGASPTLGYNLSSAAASATITVTDTSGNTVYSGVGTTNHGNNSFSWNGKDKNGRSMPSGSYNVAVSAIDLSGNKIATNLTTNATVNSISMQNGTPILNLSNGIATTLGQVTNVAAQISSLP